MIQVRVMAMSAAMMIVIDALSQLLRAQHHPKTQLQQMNLLHPAMRKKVVLERESFGEVLCAEAHGATVPVGIILAEL